MRRSPGTGAARSASCGPGRRLSRRADPWAPGCLPGLRPDRVREDRLGAGLAHGASEDGGFDEFDESDPNRRSSSATRSVNRATVARSRAFSASSRSIVAACRATRAASSS